MFVLQSPLLCPFKQTIEAKNIIIENLMFLMSDASNKKIFTLLSYTEDFRSEAERIRLLNFSQDIRARCLLIFWPMLSFNPIPVSAPYDFLSPTPLKKTYHAIRLYCCLLLFAFYRFQDFSCCEWQQCAWQDYFVVFKVKWYCFEYIIYSRDVDYCEH